MLAFNNGKNQSNLRKDDILACPLEKPALVAQKKLVEDLDETFEKLNQAKANLQKNLQNAKQLFESELNRIFSEKGEDWEEKRLGEICEIRNGKNQSEVLNPNGKYPIMGSGGNVMGYADKYICEEGTTIIGRKGNISKPLYIEEKFWNVDTAFGIYPKNNIPTRYIYYICLGINFVKMNRGTTIPSLVKSELLQIPIFIPKSLKTQQTIVEKLDTLSAETKKLESIYKQKLVNLEELKKRILADAFNGRRESHT